MSADADRISISYVEESTWGETPATPTLKALRLTSESLSMETSTENSAELRIDRQKSDTIRTAIEAQGDLAFELSYASYDDMLASALFASAWSAPVSAIAGATNISAVAATNRFVGVHTTFAGYTAGEWISVSGFSTGANNGLFKIVSVNSSDPGTTDNDSIEVIGGTLVNEAIGSAITITQHASIKNGTAKRSFTIQKHYTDLTNTYAIFRGMCINTMSIEMALESVITGSFNFMGANEEWASASVSTDPVTPAPSNKVMNTVDHIALVMEAYDSFDATNFSVELTNNLRTRGILGKLAKDSIGTGLCDVNGTVQAYFASKEMMEKYVAFTSTSIAIVLQDAHGNRYIVDLPEVKFTQATAVAGGQSSDIIADMAYSAQMSPTEGITIRIVRIPASV